ncbi:MAG TPA: septum formation family protein [Candidatus Limnocylindria bacterium]
MWEEHLEPLSGRWVCPRCYESNDADVSLCARCGLERGADPSPAASASEAGGASSGQPWAPVAQQSQRPAWQQLLMRFGWVGVVIAIAIGGVLLNAKRDDAGQISGGGNLQVQDLRIGDCFNLKDESDENVSEVDAKPCVETHKYELYHEASLSDGDYPPADQLTSYAEQECVGAFLTYVGTTYENSSLEVLYFTPTSDAWGSGDRSVQCAAYDPARETLSGSLKGAHR